MTLEEMKQRKKELGYTYARLSELSGVPLSTVQKIFGGATTAPRYDTMLALESLLVPAPSQTASASADTASHPGSYEEHAAAFSEEELSHAGQVGESSPPYQVKRQGEYTLTDYYQIPDERRVELIDGVIYDMSAPGCDHQLIAGLIARTASRTRQFPKGHLSPHDLPGRCAARLR